MRFPIIALLCCFMMSAGSFAQENTDSIKSEMEKIVISNSAVKSNIEKYQKGVIKGDLKSMTLLGVECMSGQNIKADMRIGLNLLETAANSGYLDAQYDLGNYYFLFWLQKPDNDRYFTTSSKWLRKAIKTGDINSIILLSKLYFEYGKQKQNYTFFDASIAQLGSIPNIETVNDKDESIVESQALMGNICLSKWRLSQDTISLREAKKWYRTVLRSKIEYPNFTNYIDSLVIVLSQGVNMSIDPVVEEKATDNAAPQGMGGFGGGMGMGGFPGGGMGGMGGQQGGAPTGPQAQYHGGFMAMNQFIRSNTTYPKGLQERNIKGNVTVGFTIGTDGAVIYPTIINGGNYLMEREALRTIMMMPDWIPAKDGDKPVEAKSQTTVNFGSGGGGMMMF